MAYQFMVKLKKQTDKEGFIYLRYSFKETECLISTGTKIEIRHWDQAKGKVRQSYPGGKVTIDRKLTTIKGDVMKAATELENDGELPLADEVKKRYQENHSGIIRGATKAVTLWEQFIKDGDGKKSLATIRNETEAMTTFIEFLAEKKKPGITVRRIDKALIGAYEQFLSKYKDNTRAKKLKHLKAFLKSIKHGATELLNPKEYAGDKIFLTEQELTAVEKYPFEPGSQLAGVRDLVSLQCEIGWRVSDLMRLGKEHIQDGVLVIRTRKTGEEIRAPFSPIIAEIITRYNHAIPRMPDPSYNEKLKEVLKAAIPESKCEVTERKAGTKTITTKYKHEVFTSHGCVRTAINLMAQRGMPIPSIAKQTGKSVATLLKSYLRPDAEQAFKDAQTFARVKMAVNR